MPFTRCTITLESAYPLVVQFTYVENKRWVLTSMWREVSPRRADDDSYEYISAIAKNSLKQLEPFFKDHAERHSYVAAIKTRLIELLGSKSVISTDQQRSESAELLRILPEIHLYPADAIAIRRGFSVRLQYTEHEGPFSGDMIASVKFEPPMS